MESDGMNDAELTILSLLAESDRYDIEVNQIIEERGLRAWINIGLSSIFYILNKLERQNMVNSGMRSDGHGVARRYFSITDAGRGVLQTAIADLLRQPRSLGNGFELGLANLHVLKPYQVYQNMSHHRSDLQKRLEVIEKTMANSKTLPLESIQAMYTHSAALMRAELAWLDQFLSAWVERYPAVNERPASKPTTPENWPPTDSNSAATRISRNPTPDPAKQLQQLKRPKREE